MATKARGSPRVYDAIVVGVGGMGSAACYHLARRGLRTLGLERFDIPHSMGSSHGITRIIRLAYYEHPSYVPLLLRGFELWDELERESGRHLLEVTGTIDASGPEEMVFTGALASCKEFGLAHEVLTSAELTARYPGYALPPDHLALFQSAAASFCQSAALAPTSKAPSPPVRTSGPGSEYSVGNRWVTVYASAPTAASTRRGNWCSRPAPGWPRWFRR